MLRQRRYSPEPKHEHPRASLPTEYGELQLIVIDGDIVSLSTPHPNGSITVNRIEVTLFGASLRRAKSGAWHWENASHIHVTRKDGSRPSGTYNGLSWNAYDRLRDTIPAAVRKWADTNPEILKAGAIATRAQRLDALKAELDQTVDQATTLRSQIETLTDEIAALEHGAA